MGDVAHHIVQRLVVTEAAVATAGQQRRHRAGVLESWTLMRQMVESEELVGWLHATRYACSDLEANLFSQAGLACSWQTLTSHAQ